MKQITINIYRTKNVYNNVQIIMQNHYKEIYVIICVHIHNLTQIYIVYHMVKCVKIHIIFMLRINII